MEYILNNDGSVSKAKKKKDTSVTQVKVGEKPALSEAVKNYKDTVKNSAVKSNGFNMSNLITDLANINDAQNDVLKSIPVVGNIYKAKEKAAKTTGNIATNMGVGAMKSIESAGDTLSDLVFNPLERAQNYAIDYITKGKDVAKANYKDLKEQQKRDIQRDLTKEFQDKVGYGDVVDDFEKDSLVKRENLGGQISQGIGGMVPALVLGQAFGGGNPLKSTKGLRGADKVKTILQNIGTTYLNQLPANAMLTAQSYGSGVEEALNEGATMDQARKYGLLNAAIEQGTEMVTGGVPGLGGKGGIDNVVDPLIDKTSNGYLRSLLKSGYKFAGEGAEEWLSAVLNPLAKKTYSDEPIDWKDTLKQANQSFLLGGTIGSFLDSPQLISDLRDARVESQMNKQKAQQEAISEPSNQMLNKLNDQSVIEKLQKNGDFAEQVDKYISKKLPSGDTLYLGNTSKTLQDIGLNNLPITMKQSTLNKIISEGPENSNLHGISPETIKRIPAALENPLNVLKSSSRDNSVVVITDLADNMERPIIASVEMDSKGQIGNIKFLDNSVTSAYGKNNYEDFMNREIEKGNLLYDIDEGIKKEVPTTRVQSSEGITSTDNISQNNKNVNPDTFSNDNNNKNLASTIENPVIQAKEFGEAKQRLSNGTATERDRSFIKSAVEAQHSEEIVKEMDDALKTYTPQSNEKSIKEAEAQLRGIENIDDKAKYISDMLRSGKRITASDMAATELVLKDVLASKNPKLYNDILSDAAILGTEYGQVIQIMSKIKAMSPTGQLDVLEKAINREKAKGNKAYANLEVTEEMKNRIFDCYDENGNVNQEQLDNTMNEITQELADSMKTTADEKARAWRYLSMLGNPKTHVRNVVANVAMTITKAAKDTVNAVGQDLFVKDKANKTATLKAASKDVKNLANTTYEEVAKQTQGNKYNEKNALENKKQIFKTGWLEKLRKINDRLLSAEDQAFKKINYKRAFSNYLTAQGISTQEDIQNNPQIVEKAKQFAINEANVATFNEQNKLAEFINSGEKKLDGISGVVYRTARGAIIPFTRTPLNIAKRGIEYTPGIGMATTIAEVQKAPKSMKGTVLIDGLSKQITGASLAMLGYALSKAGWVTAKTDDDKDDQFEKDQGSKADYSIKIGDTSYDLSWLSPSSMPFFVGARAFEVLDKQEGINENFILEALASTLDPLSEMSCISSFTDVLKSFSKSGTGQIKDIGITATQNYLSQFIPTVVGQFARTFDDTKRSTGADKGAENKISQETYRKLAYKVPGLRNTLPASTDYLGKEKKEDENTILRAFNAFINPSNTKKDTITKEGKELVRLYNKTGNDKILPYAMAQNAKFNDNNYQMTKKEYNQYKKTFGDAYMKNAKELMNTNEYKSASDDEKATMLEGLMNYSKDKAKDTFLTGKGEDYSKTTKTGEKSPYISDKVDSLTGDNFSIADYYIYKTYTPNIVNGTEEATRNRLNTINTFGIDYQTYSKYMDDIGQIKGKDRKKKVFEYINGLNLTSQQKQVLMKKEYSTYRTADRELFNTIKNSNLTLEEKEKLRDFLKIGK